MMKYHVFVLSAALAAGAAIAQNPGPDVIVGDITAPTPYGSVGGIAAFAFGTTSCNIGSQPMPWVGSTNHHPVISQGLFRILNGRFEQIGVSWLKHGFGASTGSLCGTCQNPNNGQILGVGCSDPYGAGTNGNQSGLGPRSEVNPSTGDFPYPFTAVNFGTIIDRRLQVHESDLDPVANGGAIYLAEAQYVTPDDAAAGNGNNNASWRQCTVAGTPGAYTLGVVNATVAQHAAIEAWPVFDPAVTLQYIDVPDGRFIVARKIVNFGGGLQIVTYAVHNLNSERACQSFQVNFPTGTQILGSYFHDVDYHSGDPFSGADWTPSIANASITWSCETWIQNQNANALRWGTTYTFAYIAMGGTPTGFNLAPFKPVGCPPPPVISSPTTYVANPTALFDHVNLGATAQPGPAGDDMGVVVALPGGLTLPFFDLTLTQVGISTNGYVYVPGQNGAAYTNVPIPTAGAPDGFIAGYWDDLYVGPPNGSGTCIWDVVGTAPHRRLVVQWLGVYRYNTTNPESFEIIIDEGTGNVSSTIITTTDGGASATRGIESPSGTVGTQISFNAPGSAIAGTTVRYTRHASVPYSAALTLAGNGLANSAVSVTVLSTKYGGPVVLIAATDPGPTNIGALGTLDIGFSTPWLAVADGVGAFGPADPAAVTDACGLYTFSYTFGATGLPSGATLYFQGFVADSQAPNGSFHLSLPRTLAVP